MLSGHPAPLWAGPEKEVTLLRFEHVNLSYGGQKILNDISFEIQDGQFAVFIGPSGCGKTTTLKMINRLIQPDSGHIYLDGKDISTIDRYELRRHTGYVIQQIGLFPNMTVHQNICVVPKLLKWPKDKCDQVVRELLDMVGLPYDQYAHKYPSEMSGGQQQRIGILRALAASPPVVLMDEPFSALDPMTRAELQDEVHRLQLRFHKTIVFVTHDMDEAVKLADRICILQNGHVVQCDKPENILKHPANEYINSFIGKNRLWENPSFIRAEDIMRPRPITISQSRTVVQAVQLMRHYNIDSLLVTGDDNKFAGMVWLQDLIGIDQYSSPVSSFLSDDYLSVRVDDSLSTVLEKVADYGEKDFGILPVLDAEGAIRGFLNRSSLLSTLSRRFIDEPVERDEQEGA